MKLFHGSDTRLFEPALDPGSVGAGPSLGAMESMINADLTAANGGTSAPPELPPVVPAEGGGAPDLMAANNEQPTPPTPEATPPNEQQTPEQAAATETDSEGLKPEGVDVSDARWQRMVTSNKYAREVAKALELVDPTDTNPLDASVLPSATEIREAFDSRSALEAMQADFLSPDPQDTRNLIGQWNEVSPEAMQRFASELPGTLAQISPAAYNAVATPVIQRFIDYMYEAAAAEGRPDMQKAILHGAQLAEWWATGGPNDGRYRPTEEIQRAMEQRTSDPLAQERARLAAERAQINQHYQQMEASNWNNFQGETNSTIDNKIDEMAERDLAPLKAANIPDSHFQALKDSYVRNVHERVQANKSSMRLFNIHYEQARRTYSQNPNDLREALVGEYLRMAAPAANAIKAKFVSQQSQAIVAQNQARNAQLKSASAKVGANGSGPARTTPGANPTGNLLPRGEGETQSDWFMRNMQADLTNAQRSR